MKLEVLDRVDQRWRVRVHLPEGEACRGFTVGFVGEDGAPLGPAVVGPEGACGACVVEVRGPCTLPPGAVARLVVHTTAGGELTCDETAAQRRGLHAWLNADSRLPLVSRAEPESLGVTARRRLGARWCWLAPEDLPGGTRPSEPVPPDVRDMLAEFGVDADEVSEELVNQLRAGAARE